MSHAKHIAAGVILLSGLCLLVACGGEPAASSVTEVPAATEATAAPMDTLTPQPPAAAQECEEMPSSMQCDLEKLEFPLPPDAACCVHVDPITNFRTGLTPDEVLQFYADNLTQNGWTRASEGGISGLASLSAWTKDTKQLNVVTSVDERGTAVQIQVLSK